MTYKLSPRGIKFIKDAEGLRLEAYQCSAKVWTIGYGSTEGVVKGMRITEKEAETLLKRDLRYFEAEVNKLVKVPLTQSQYDAIVSLVFNIGVGAFKKSTLLRKLNAKEYIGASGQFTRWNKAGGKENRGLVLRRRREMALFDEDTWETDDTPNDIQTDISGQKPIVTKESITWGTGIVATGLTSVADVDSTSPIAYVLAGIMAISFVIGMYMYFKGRKS
jgi:lysozyme